MIRNHRAFVLAFLSITPAFAASQDDAIPLLNAAAKAMHVEDVTTIRYTATGSAFAIGQSYTAGGPYPRLSLKFTRDFDLDAFAARQELVTKRVDRRGGGLPNRIGAEAKQVQYISRTAPWFLHVFLWLNPVGFIKEAPKHNPVLTLERVDGRRYRVITVKVQDRFTLRGYFNDLNLLEHVDTALDNNSVLGDPPLDGVFTGYKDFDGIVFPSRIVHHLGLQPSFDFHIESVTPNAKVNTAPPASETSAAAAPARVTSQMIATGIHHITGAALHSVAVEFSDYVAVIDAPLSEARSLAVIAEVKKLIPNKPIRYLINTHHHFDHTNGLRTYAAEGATIITYPRNATFYQQWWSKPTVLLNDALAQSGRTARFETVSNRKVLGDGSHRLELYVVKNTNHVEGMLIGYVPQEKLLVEADLFTPSTRGAEQNPQIDNGSAKELLQNIERLKLDVERILPLQGPGIASRNDLESSAAEAR